MTFALIMLTLLIWVIAFFALDHFVFNSFFAKKIMQLIESHEAKNKQ